MHATIAFRRIHRLCLQMLAAQLEVMTQQIFEKDRLGSITYASNRYLTQRLVVGAMAVIRCSQRYSTKRP